MNYKETKNARAGMYTKYMTVLGDLKVDEVIRKKAKP